MTQLHLRATLNRAGDCSCVLAIHDSTCIDCDTDFPRDALGFSTVPKRQGYIAHVSLLVDNDHNLPLGVGAVETITRKLKNRKEKLRKSAAAGEERESARWLRGVSAVEAGKSESCEVIHIMDAEADFYELMLHLHKLSASFVIRAGQFKRIVSSLEDGSRDKLKCLLDFVEPQGTWDFSIQARKPKKFLRTDLARKRHPPRQARTAAVVVGSTKIQIHRREGITDGRR